MVKVLVLTKKLLKQVVIPHYNADPASLFMKVYGGLTDGSSQLVGWMWKTALPQEEMVNQHGHGEYLAATKVWLVVHDGSPYIIPAPAGGVIANKFPAPNQLFVG